MFHVETINVYDHYGLEKEQKMAGNLTCMYHATSRKISESRTRPAVLILPGGGYGMVSDREAEPIALRFVSMGYAAFVLRYSVKPHTFPVALREAAMAMKFIRENCEKFEVDPGMVAAIGFSAGGHLCGTLGMMYDCPEVADIGLPEKIRPNALGLAYPVAVSWGKTHDGSFQNLTGNDPELTARLSLDRLVRGDMPPVFLWHTRTDRSVPCRNSLVLAQALDDAGVDYTLRIYHDGPHGLSTAEENTYRTDKVPYVSEGILKWEEQMMAFFRECGLKIRDHIDL